MKVDIKLLDERYFLDVFAPPNYAEPGSAGIDLRACITEPLPVYPGEVQLVGSGVAVHIKNDHLCAMLYPRSGLGHKSGIILGNGTGVIDSSYTGEIKMSIWNRSENRFVIKPGDRIAQMVFVPIIKAEFNLVEKFEDSSRGDGGFGSTGVS